MPLLDCSQRQSLAEQVLPRCRHAVRSLLLIGSMAEGHANSSSDIDLVAIVSDPGRRFRVVEHGFHLDDQPVSVVYITEAMLRRRLKRLDGLYRAGGHITEGISTRIANAIVIFDPEGIGQAVVGEAQRYVPSTATCREMMRIAFGFINDALGSRGAADYGTAVLMARAGASVAVDCFLLDHHERNLKLKWHLRRLAKAGAATLLDQYLKILGLDGMTAEDADRVIRQTERLFCTVLQVSTLDRFNESPLFARVQ
jgi:predicted nucleotidyltransferase